VNHTGTGTLTYEYSNFGLTSGCSTYDAILVGPNYTVRYSRFTSHIDEGPRDSGNNILDRGELHRADLLKPGRPR
jgi:hypothetical protein